MLPRRKLRELLFLQLSLLNKLFCPVTKSDSQLLSAILAGIEMWIPGVGTAFYLEAFGFRSRERFSRARGWLSR